MHESRENAIKNSMSKLKTHYNSYTNYFNRRVYYNSFMSGENPDNI